MTDLENKILRTRGAIRSRLHDLMIFNKSDYERVPNDILYNPREKELWLFQNTMYMQNCKLQEELERILFDYDAMFREVLEKAIVESCNVK